MKKLVKAFQLLNPKHSQVLQPFKLLFTRGSPEIDYVLLCSKFVHKVGGLILEGRCIFGRFWYYRPLHGIILAQ